MPALRSISDRWNPLWLVAIGVAALLAFAITTGSSEASDGFGDSVSSTGTVVDEGNATGPDDTNVASLEPGATVTIVFGDNVAFNGIGDDITLHFLDQEGAATADVELSQDGVTFEPAVSVGDDTADRTLDLGALSFVKALRITNTDLTENLLDLDAVEATNALLLDVVTVELDPAEAINPIETEHEVTATVDDGSPVVDVELTWQVTAGPNAGAPSTDDTDGSGESLLTYTGNGGAGVDEIVAYLDLDGSGTLDEGEPAGTATKRWLGVTGTIDLIDLDGDLVALGDVLTVRVEDSDLDLTDAADSVEVMVSSDTDGTGFALQLTETGAHSGVFEGSMFLAATTDNGAFELAANVGDTITASYDDELDAEGDDPPAVTAMLVVESDTDEAGDKVTICHVPGGNPANQHEISVGAPARTAHLDHGDSLGECGEVNADDIKPQQDFCEKRSDHPRCEDDASELELESASDDVADASDERGPQDQAFCERRPDHRKCVDSGDSSPGVVGDDEDGDDD